MISVTCKNVNDKLSMIAIVNGGEKPMPYTINYDDLGMIKLVYEGDADLKDLKEVITRGVALAMEKNCFRVLSDFRAMKLHLSVTALFSIPLEQISLSRELRIPYFKFKRAVVVPEKEFENYKFVENVAVNRSHQLKIFLDMQDAISWLLKE